MTMINSRISLETHGDIAVITSDNPPVNALGAEVRVGLIDAIAQAVADAGVKAIVLACTGKTFFAGADVTEFGKPKHRPVLQDVIAQLEQSPKPVVAAIHGTALGGGLETALGAHFRVAIPSAQLGLPEIKLGIFPAGGGTQLLSRLIGPIEALKLILSGERLSAETALQMGILDHVEEGDPVAIGVAFARRVLSEGLTAIPIRDRDEKLAAFRADPAAFDLEAAAQLKRKQAQDAPAACVDSIRRSFTLPIEQALAADMQEFAKLVTGTQSKALRHLFFAEREAAKLPRLSDGVRPRPVQKAMVIGAGTMGGGIAMCFAGAGIPVTLVDSTQDGLDAGLARMRANYATSVKRGSLTQADMDRRLALISGSTGRDAAADTDMVIEAVFENMKLKKEIFADLAARTRPGVVLASNTSALDLDEIAGATTRANDVIGMHFFSPANVMRLLEVVRARETGDAAVATAVAVGKAIGKAPVISGNCDGFIGNRMVAKRSAQVDTLMLEGALPRQVDSTIKAFGFPMGPLETNDMSGLDIGWSIRKRRGTPFAIADAICERGWFGQKTGRGYYLYENGSRTPMANPEVEALIIAKSVERGVTRREIAQQELTERMIYPLVNEGARILQEGISLRSGDVDVVWTTGYGFPAWRGGPMFYADTIGLKMIADRLDFFAEQTGNPDLRSARLLRTLADKGASFAEWDKNRSLAD